MMPDTYRLHRRRRRRRSRRGWGRNWGRGRGRGRGWRRGRGNLGSSRGGRHPLHPGGLRRRRHIGRRAANALALALDLLQVLLCEDLVHGQGKLRGEHKERSTAQMSLLRTGRMNMHVTTTLRGAHSLRAVAWQIR